ncbi:hypothetical protein [Klebsiella oxytoca]
MGNKIFKSPLILNKNAQSLRQAKERGNKGNSDEQEMGIIKEVKKL